MQNISPSELWVFVIFNVMTAWASGGLCRSMLYALMGMHRSKTAVKKIMSQYRFVERLCLKPYWNDMIHAKRFAKQMVIFQYFNGAVTLAMLAVPCLASCLIITPGTGAWIILGKTVLLDFPCALLCVLLENRSWKRKFSGWKFEKYHHTDEKNQLF